MPKKPRPKKPPETYTLLGIRVDDYEVSVDASFNLHVRQPELAGDVDDDDPVFRHVTHLTIVGTCTYPDARAGDGFEVTIYGDDAPSRAIQATLKDIQVVGEYGAPAYREYRGRRVPVYRPPPGFGLLDKVRGQQAWTAWINLAPRLVSDMLTVFGHNRQLFLSIHERKVARTRWVNAISLQTTDPAEE